MDLGIKNKIAFVASSSQGLGKSVALELALEGAQVIISSRNPANLEKTKQEIQENTNTEIFSVAGDLSVTADRERIIHTVLEKFAKVDILVTNTGGPPSGKFESFSQEDWEKAYHQLLVPVVGLVQGFLPGMKTQRWGRIVAITSMAVKQPVSNLVLSNSVRASVAGLVKTLSNELASYGITVNNVLPGYTETDRLKELLKDEAAYSAAKAQVPLGRIGKPEEFAAAVAFLASERAAYITGVSLAVDGGWIKGLF